jgi:hypothetical protein
LETPIRLARKGNSEIDPGPNKVGVGNEKLVMLIGADPGFMYAKPEVKSTRPSSEAEFPEAKTSEGRVP